MYLIDLSSSFIKTHQNPLRTISDKQKNFEELYIAFDYL